MKRKCIYVLCSIFNYLKILYLLCILHLKRQFKHIFNPHLEQTVWLVVNLKNLLKKCKISGISSIALSSCHAAPCSYFKFFNCQWFGHDRVTSVTKQNFESLKTLKLSLETPHIFAI